MGPQEDYIETVVTCEGDFHDPQLRDRLRCFQQQLESLLLKDDKKQLVLKKVEPWNSVRVTFNIPKQAALRLKQLAEQGSPVLRQIGVLGVQIQGDRLVSLTVATPNNQRAELIISTQDGTGQSGSSQSSATAAGMSGDVRLPSSSEELGSPGASMEVTRKNIEEYLKQGSLFNCLLTPSSASGPSAADQSVETCKPPVTVKEAPLHHNSMTSKEVHTVLEIPGAISRAAVSVGSKSHASVESFLPPVGGSVDASAQLGPRVGSALHADRVTAHRHPLQHTSQQHPQQHLPSQHSLQHSTSQQHLPPQHLHHPTSQHPLQHPTPQSPLPHPSSQHPLQYPPSQHPLQNPSSQHLQPSTQHRLQNPSSQHPLQHPPIRHPLPHHSSRRPLQHTSPQHLQNPSSQHPLQHPPPRHPLPHSSSQDPLQRPSPQHLLQNPSSQHSLQHPTPQHSLQHPSPQHPLQHLHQQRIVQQPVPQHPAEHIPKQHPLQYPTPQHPIQHPAQQYHLQQSPQHPSQHPPLLHPIQHSPQQHPVQQSCLQQSVQNSYSQQIVQHPSPQPIMAQHMHQQLPSQGTALPQTAVVGDSFMSLPPPPPYPHKKAAGKGNRASRKGKKTTNSSPLLTNLLQTKHVDGTSDGLVGKVACDKPKKKRVRRRRCDKQTSVSDDECPRSMPVDSSKSAAIDALPSLPSADVSAVLHRSVTPVPLPSPGLNPGLHSVPYSSDHKEGSVGFRDGHPATASAALVSLVQNQRVTEETEQLSVETIINPYTGHMEPRDSVCDLSPVREQHASPSTSLPRTTHKETVETKADHSALVPTADTHRRTGAPDSAFLGLDSSVAGSAVPDTLSDEQLKKYPTAAHEPLLHPVRTASVTRDGMIQQHSHVTNPKVTAVPSQLLPVAPSHTCAPLNTSQIASVRPRLASRPVTSNTVTMNGPVKLTRLPTSLSVSSSVAQISHLNSQLQVRSVVAEGQFSYPYHNQNHSASQKIVPHLVGNGQDVRLGARQSLESVSRGPSTYNASSYHPGTTESQPAAKKAKLTSVVRQSMHQIPSSSGQSQIDSLASVPAAAQQLAGEFAMNMGTNSPAGSRLLSDGDDNSNHSPVSQTDGIAGPSSLLDANGGKVDHHDSGIGSLSERSDDTTPSEAGDGDFQMSGSVSEPTVGSSNSGKPGGSMKMAANCEKESSSKEPLTVTVGHVQMSPHSALVCRKEGFRQDTSIASLLIGNKVGIADSVQHAHHLIESSTSLIPPIKEEAITAQKFDLAAVVTDHHLRMKDGTVASASHQIMGVHQNGPASAVESPHLQLPQTLHLSNTPVSVHHPTGISNTHNQGSVRLHHPPSSVPTHQALHHPLPSAPGLQRLIRPPTSVGSSLGLRHPMLVNPSLRLLNSPTTVVDSKGLHHHLSSVIDKQQLNHPSITTLSSQGLHSTPSLRQPSVNDSPRLLHLTRAMPASPGIQHRFVVNNQEVHSLPPSIPSSQGLRHASLSATNHQPLHHPVSSLSTAQEMPHPSPSEPGREGLHCPSSDGNSPGLHHPSTLIHSGQGLPCLSTVANQKGVQHPFSTNQKIHQPLSSPANTLHRPHSVPNNYGVLRASSPAPNNRGSPHPPGIHRLQHPSKTFPHILGGIGGQRLSQSLPNSLGQGGCHFGLNSGHASLLASEQVISDMSSVAPPTAAISSQGGCVLSLANDNTLLSSSPKEDGLASLSLSSPIVMSKSTTNCSPKQTQLVHVQRPQSNGSVISTGLHPCVPGQFGQQMKISELPHHHEHLSPAGPSVSPLSRGPLSHSLPSLSPANLNLPSSVPPSSADDFSSLGASNRDAVQPHYQAEQGAVDSKLSAVLKELEDRNSQPFRAVRSQVHSATLSSGQHKNTCPSAMLTHSVPAAIVELLEKELITFPTSAPTSYSAQDGAVCHQSKQASSMSDQSNLPAEQAAASLPKDLDLGILASDLKDIDGLFDPEEELAFLMEPGTLDIDLKQESGSNSVGLCTESGGGSNITSIYTKRTSPVNVNMLNHIYTAGLPQPRRLTESVQRLVKPLPAPENTSLPGRACKPPATVSQHHANGSASPSGSGQSGAKPCPSIPVVSSQTLPIGTRSVVLSTVSSGTGIRYVLSDSYKTAQDAAGAVPNGAYHLVDSSMLPSAAPQANIIFSATNNCHNGQISSPSSQTACFPGVPTGMPTSVGPASQLSMIITPQSAASPLAASSNLTGCTQNQGYRDPRESVASDSGALDVTLTTAAAHLAPYQPAVVTREMMGESVTARGKRPARSQKTKNGSEPKRKRTKEQR